MLILVQQIGKMIMSNSSQLSNSSFHVQSAWQTLIKSLAVKLDKYVLCMCRAVPWMHSLLNHITADQTLLFFAIWTWLADTDSKQQIITERANHEERLCKLSLFLNKNMDLSLIKGTGWTAV